MLLCEMEFEKLLIGQVSSGKIPDVYFYPNMSFYSTLLGTWLYSLYYIYVF